MIFYRGKAPHEKIVFTILTIVVVLLLRCGGVPPGAPHYMNWRSMAPRPRAILAFRGHLTKLRTYFDCMNKNNNKLTIFPNVIFLRLKCGVGDGMDVGQMRPSLRVGTTDCITLV